MAGELGYRTRYSMRLANNQRWQIIATDGVEAWADKIASIMQFDICEKNGDAKLILTGRESDEEKWKDPIRRLQPEIKASLPSRGWEFRELIWLRVWSHRDVPDVICEKGSEKAREEEILSMRMSLQPIYQRAQDSGGLPLHAGLVARDGRGIVLAAQRNTGKSTCCRRILSPWHALGDEEALIVNDNQKRYLAHPFPTWSDYLEKRSKRTWNVQQGVPLVAIFFLEQARTDEVVPVGQGEAAVLLYQSATQVCYRNWVKLNGSEIRPLRRKLFENACELARTIPSFKLRVSLKGRFWEEMEKVLA
jgi:SynChlorMet cassette protein ScmC